TLIRLPSRHTLFPYTTLFRSGERQIEEDRRDQHDRGERVVQRRRHAIREVLRDVEERRLDSKVPIERLQEVDDHEKDGRHGEPQDRKSTRLNSSHEWISYAVF